MISVAGSQMQVWAIHWHVRDLTDPSIAALALGSIGLARILPVLIFSLIGGVIADSANRRKLMFLTQTAMALLAASLAWLTFSGHIALWQIYLITALQAVAISFDQPARQALVPNLVPVRDLPNAFSLTSIASNAGSMLGPALSGIVIARLGMGYTYLFNAVSFLAVLIALFAMGPVEQKIVQRKQPVSLKAILEGIQFIRSTPMILSTMLTDFFATFFSSANTLMPIIARDILKVGVEAYGWLSAAQSIGSVSAGLFLSQLHTIRRQGRVFLGAVMFFGLATIAFGLANSFWLAMFALILVGAADAVSTVIRNTIRQMLTPDHIRGRMVSINQIFFQGGPQLGEVEAGLVAQFFSAPVAVITGGIGTIIAVFIIVRRWPVIARYDGSEPIPALTPAD